MTPYFDDLLNVPYKAHGRDKNGYDCYGLVIECCRRINAPIPDVWYEADNLPADSAEAYIQNGLNVRKIPTAQKNSIVEMEYNGNLHIGFMVDRDNVIHTTQRGVRITPIFYCKAYAFYEVI